MRRMLGGERHSGRGVTHGGQGMLSPLRRPRYSSPYAYFRLNRPPRRHCRRPSHSLCQVRDCAQIDLRHRPWQVLCCRAHSTERSRREARRRAHLRNRRSLRHRTEHRARSVAHATPPQGSAVIQRKSRVCISQSGHHGRRGPDRPWACRCDHRRRCRVAVQRSHSPFTRHERRARGRLQSQELQRARAFPRQGAPS